jgi:hypothetical protein
MWAILTLDLLSLKRSHLSGNKTVTYSADRRKQARKSSLAADRARCEKTTKRLCTAPENQNVGMPIGAMDQCSNQPHLPQQS